MVTTHIRVWTDKKTMATTRRSYFYRISADGSTKVAEGSGTLVGSMNRAILMGIDSALSRFNRPSKILISSDCVYVQKQVLGNMQKWKDLNYKREDGSEMANADLISAIYDKTEHMIVETEQLIV